MLGPTCLWGLHHTVSVAGGQTKGGLQTWNKAFNADPRTPKVQFVSYWIAAEGCKVSELNAEPVCVTWEAGVLGVDNMVPVLLRISHKPTCELSLILRAVEPYLGWAFITVTI